MQTHLNPEGDPENPYARPWFYDLYWRDGTPYDPKELELIRGFAHATRDDRS